MKLFIVVLALVGLSYGVQRPVVEKIVKLDTITTFDTVKTLRFDTLKITTIFQDTAIRMKAETTKVLGVMPKAKAKK